MPLGSLRAGAPVRRWRSGSREANRRFDLWPVDIRRFGQPHTNLEWVRERTHEMYGKHYTMAWPHEEHQSGRPFRCSPLYEDLKSQGACFGEKLGWERPNLVCTKRRSAQRRIQLWRANWVRYSGDEHRAAREAVAVFDQTSFGKFIVEGADSAQALEWICANRIGRWDRSYIPNF